LGSTQKTAFSVHPFGKQYGMGWPQYDEQPLPNRQNR
jgi:hypothetical protein